MATHQGTDTLACMHVYTSARAMGDASKHLHSYTCKYTYQHMQKSIGIIGDTERLACMHTYTMGWSTTGDRQTCIHTCTHIRKRIRGARGNTQLETYMHTFTKRLAFTRETYTLAYMYMCMCTDAQRDKGTPGDTDSHTSTNACAEMHKGTVSVQWVILQNTPSRDGFSLGACFMKPPLGLCETTLWGG